MGSRLIRFSDEFLLALVESGTKSFDYRVESLKHMNLSKNQNVPILPGTKTIRIESKELDGDLDMIIAPTIYKVQDKPFRHIIEIFIKWLTTTLKIYVI